MMSEKMDAGVEIALIVGATTVTTGMVTMLSAGFQSWVAIKTRRRERLEDWERQDRVADRVERMAKTTGEQAAALIGSSISIEKKLDVVHGLVNSALTTVKQSEYDGLLREMGLKEENIKLQATAGDAPSKVDTDYLELLAAKISDLRAELADRTKEAVILSKQQAEHDEETARDIRRRGEDLGK